MAVMRSTEVSLRPTTPEDFPALRRLFDQPSFFGWGGVARLSDAMIREKYLGARYPDVECFLVMLRHASVGLTQFHAAAEAGSGGIDLILLPEARGQGIGRTVVEEMVERAGTNRRWTRLTVDPDLANERGIAFWTAVGFTPERVVREEPGRVPYVLMTWSGDLALQSGG